MVCVYLIMCNRLFIHICYVIVYMYIFNAYTQLIHVCVSIHVKRARVYSTRTGFCIIVIHISYVHLFKQQQLAILLIIDYTYYENLGIKFNLDNGNYHILRFFMILFYIFYVWFTWSLWWPPPPQTIFFPQFLCLE